MKILTLLCFQALTIQTKIPTLKNEILFHKKGQTLNLKTKHIKRPNFSDLALKGPTSEHSPANKRNPMLQQTTQTEHEPCGSRRTAPAR